MNHLQEMQEQFKAQLKDLDGQIEALKSKKAKAISDGQNAMISLWDKESPIKKGARCVLGPKMHEVGVRFNKYRPTLMEVNVYELTKAKTRKETYRSFQTLQSFVKAYPDVPFTNPGDSGYNKLRPLNPKDLKSYQGFRVGQLVTWSEFDRWHRSHHEGKISNFTPTGKVTVKHGYEGRLKATLKIKDIKPVN